MKIKVIKAFNDRTAYLVTRKVGETIEVTDERAKELINRGFAEAYTEPDAKPKTNKK